MNFLRILLISFSLFFISFASLEYISYLSLSYYQKNPPKFHMLFTSTKSKENPTVFDPHLSYKFDSNKEIFLTENENIKIDHFGFINYNFDYDLKSNKKRILILGSSSAVGTGSTNEKNTIFYNVFKNLEANYEIINASVVGYTSHQSIIQLTSLLRELNPQVIINYGAWTDFFQSSIVAGYLSERDRKFNKFNNHRYASYQNYIFQNKSYLKSGSKKYDFLSNFYLFRLFDIISFKLTKKYLLGVYEYNNNLLRRKLNYIKISPKEAADIYSSNINTIIDLITSKNIKFINLIEPSIFTENFLSTNNQVKKNIYIKHNPDIEKKQLVYYENVEKNLTTYSKKNPMIFCNFKLTNIKDSKMKNKDFFIDMVHTTDYANFIIANKISKLVKNFNELSKCKE